MRRHPPGSIMGNYPKQGNVRPEGPRCTTCKGPLPQVTFSDEDGRVYCTMNCKANRPRIGEQNER